MSDCCSTSSYIGRSPKKYRCPVNGNEYSDVALATVMHHIHQPWLWSNVEQSYYFCDDPDCDVVYFGLDNSVLNKSQLRTTVGAKEKSGDSLICYCYGVTLHDATTNPDIRAFVAQQTKSRACACKTRNPSGKCCLKDFPST